MKFLSKQIEMRISEKLLTQEVYLNLNGRRKYEISSHNIKQHRFIKHKCLHVIIEVCSNYNNDNYTYVYVYMYIK